MQYFRKYLNDISLSLKNVVVTKFSAEIHVEEGILLWCRQTSRLADSNKTMYFIGNGASAMMASHMAADACKNAGLKSLAFNDAALLTAISNDQSYDDSFALPIAKFGNAGDILVAISSSGNSANIVKSIKAARERDMQVITLSGMGADNKIRLLGYLNFYVPAKTYGLVEVSHQFILHCWLDKYLEAWGEGSYDLERGNQYVNLR